VLLQVGNVLNVSLEQAEDVIHGTKQPGHENKAEIQVGNGVRLLRDSQMTKESGSIGIEEVV
jgi:hypothetical protein